MGHKEMSRRAGREEGGANKTQTWYETRSVIIDSLSDWIAGEIRPAGWKGHRPGPRVRLRSAGGCGSQRWRCPHLRLRLRRRQRQSVGSLRPSTLVVNETFLTYSISLLLLLLLLCVSVSCSPCSPPPLPPPPPPPPPHRLKQSIGIYIERKRNRDIPAENPWKHLNSETLSLSSSSSSSSFSFCSSISTFYYQIIRHARLHRHYLDAFIHILNSNQDLIHNWSIFKRSSSINSIQTLWSQSDQVSSTEQRHLSPESALDSPKIETGQ